VYEQEFMRRQLACVRECSGLVPGLLAAVEDLRRRGIKLATSTGYFAEAAQIAYDAAAKQGYRPDFNSCAGDVPAGRPAPWMIYRAMQALDIYPPAAVLKVGDTVPDVGEGRNAGVWTACVTSTSSGVGLSEAELAALSADERRRRCEVVERDLLAAGAHACIDSVAELPELVEQIEARLQSGERP
jgi:phosphonoacetaldehyde hydrolase